MQVIKQPAEYEPILVVVGGDKTCTCTGIIVTSVGFSAVLTICFDLLLFCNYSF